MKNFRLVILDYAKEHLDDPVTQRILSDVIIVKQKNFERTDPNLIIMDKHDMIGTHFLVYDIENFYKPKLILALRTTFEDRAQKHKVLTPIQSLIPNLSAEGQRAYHSFKAEKPILADCNSWFVDTSYTYKNSGLKLSEIGYAMVYAHVSRFGFDHILGCTNETYRASRWLEQIGHFDNRPEYDFDHPFSPGTHKFIIVKEFKKDVLQSIYQENKYLFDNLMEVVPSSFDRMSWSDAKDTFLNPERFASIQKAA